MPKAGSFRSAHTEPGDEYVPLVVPAGGTVSLPSQGATAPTIAMLDLPTSQDSCQGIELPLAFSGEAHG